MFGQLIEKHAGLSQWPDSTLRFDREKPRSIVKFGDSHTKEDVLWSAWQKKGTIFADHDYPNEVFKRRNEYHRAKTPQQPDSRKRFSCRPLGARSPSRSDAWSYARKPTHPLQRSFGCSGEILTTEEFRLFYKSDITSWLWSHYLVESLTRLLTSLFSLSICNNCGVF